jgi:hypothetical protein
MIKIKGLSCLVRQVFLLAPLLNLGASQVLADGSTPIQSTDFASLVNQHRVGQPTPVPWAGSFFPYGHNGTAVGVDSDGNRSDAPATSSTPSPMMEYEKVFSTSGAQEWEKNNHTCSKLTGDEETGCKGWYGHCNGWSAAAIKEQEPRKALSINGGNLSVAAQKGILTEYWLESDAYGEGDTNKSKKTGKWITQKGDPDYDTFWDVSPRQFFLLITNYLGIQKTGIVIDRFTGEQVWNQPLVGYRLLPIDTSSMETLTVSGRTAYRYLFAMKIYWANDGVPPGHRSKPFQVTQMSDSEEVEYLSPDYEGRLLKFYLFFESPLKVSSGGKLVQGTPRMVGDGFWYQQQSFIDQPVSMANWEKYNQGHPDFVWIPLNGFETGKGYRNPMVQGHHVDAISRALASGAQPAPTPGPTPGPSPVTPPQPPAPPASDESAEFSLTLRRTDELIGLDDPALLAKMKAFFSRAGLRASISSLYSGAQFMVQFVVQVDGGVTADSLRELLQEAGFVVMQVEKK